MLTLIVHTLILVSTMGPFQGVDKAVPAPSAALVQKGLAHLAAKEYSQAAEFLCEYLSSSARTEHPSLQGTKESPLASPSPEPNRLEIAAMVGAAQALRHLGRHGEALEFFDASLNSLGSGAESVPIRLAAAQSALVLKRYELVLQYCEPLPQSILEPSTRMLLSRYRLQALAGAGNAGEAWEEFRQLVTVENTLTPSDGAAESWQEVSLAIGYAALSQNQPQIAADVFHWTEQTNPQGTTREATLLGLAWAASRGVEDISAAIARISDFETAFPTSVHRPRVILLRGELYLQQHDDRAAENAFRQLLTQYPAAPETLVAVQHSLALSPEVPLAPEIPTAAGCFLEGAEASPQFIEAALLSSARRGLRDLWLLSLTAFLSVPAAQVKTGAILASLGQVASGNPAEELVSAVVSRSTKKDSDEVYLLLPTALEEAARWAVMHQRWDLLSPLSENDLWHSQAIRSSPTTLRLVSEGCIQQGKMQAAMQILDCLIDEHRNQDFDTLLRRAEVALAIESKPAAHARIESVAAIAASEDEQILISLLRIEWLIRDIRFEDARISIDQLLRNPAAETEIKARAQWLLGETFFLQRQFASAVEAYRAVEAMNQEGPWAAAATLQAGRCFELLGRPREAAQCYTRLLTFDGSPQYAAEAQARLAELPSSENGGRWR